MFENILGHALLHIFILLVLPPSKLSGLIFNVSANLEKGLLEDLELFSAASRLIWMHFESRFAEHFDNIFHPWHRAVLQEAQDLEDLPHLRVGGVTHHPDS